jgi:hydrogenase nickel incorporation protein HypB
LDKRVITIKKDILNANKEIACHIRAMLDKHHVRMINIMSSPGSGKTSLIMKTIAHLRGKYRIAVIEGDVASSIDADRIQGGYTRCADKYRWRLPPGCRHD